MTKSVMHKILLLFLQLCCLVLLQFFSYYLHFYYSTNTKLQKKLQNCQVFFEKNKKFFNTKILSLWTVSICKKTWKMLKKGSKC